MKPPFSVLVVNGDGSRVLRFRLPRWVVSGALGSFVVLAIAGLSGRFLLRQRDGDELASLRQRVDDQRELIESFETRVTAVGGEITAWRALHAEMWKAFGPEESEDPKPARVDEAAAEAGTIAAAIEPSPLNELDLLATSLAEEEPRRRALERVIGRAGNIMRTLPLEWPVHGRVKSEFGLRRSPWNGARERHVGIDIGSPPGTPVESPAAGTVVEASLQGGLGKHVTIDHGNGVRSRYGHMRKLEVKVGQRVEKGQVIGLVGSTGHSTGPHLHYEVRLAGKPVDPSEFLGAR